jgi:site-specific DNA-methyltransferase (adenine-specific)
MCSYQGMFPPRLAHYFIQTYSRPGDLVADPFSGRGTTTLQARVEGRRTLSNDLSPLAYVLTAAKANPPTYSEITDLLADLEQEYGKRVVRDVDISEDIRMLFHPNTQAADVSASVSPEYEHFDMVVVADDACWRDRWHSSRCTPV